jgi:YHS domain-containing protein
MEIAMLYRSALGLSAFAILTLSANLASAGDFYEEKGVAMSRFDATSFVTRDHEPMLGSQQFSTEYKGSTFYFITNSNLHLFTSNPERFAPQFSGFCALNAAQGHKVPANPRIFAVVDGKLYLFSDSEARKTWKQDIAGNLARASEQWADVSKMVAQK